MKGKKTGGRKKGTPNRATLLTKEIVNKMAVEYYDSGAMMEDISQLEPRDRLNTMIKLLSLITPKEVAISAEGQKTIEDRLRELSGEETDI